MLRELALALLGAHGALSGAPPLPLACTTQEQLFTHLNDMKSICCGQLGEAALPWGDNPFPITCLSRECERTVVRISAACGPLLNSSGFYTDWKDQLDQTVDLCQQEAPPPDPTNEYVLTGARSASAPPFTACRNASGTQRTLVGYAMPAPGAPAPPLGSTAVDLWAPPGQAVVLQFSALWLPPTGALTISSSGREIVSLSGTALPTQVIVGATGAAMHVELRAPSPSAGSRLIAFSASLSCKCVAPGSCGPHGTCSLLAGCICTGGFLGSRCDDASCIGVQCGLHGTCVSTGGVTPGRCVCDEGFGGVNCGKQSSPHLHKTLTSSSPHPHSPHLILTASSPDHVTGTVTGPCAGDYTTLGDDNAWRRLTQPGGTHCDGPNPGWGKGPYTPLNNHWCTLTSNQSTIACGLLVYSDR